MFEAYVTNLGLYPERGAGAGEYLKFPTTVEEVQTLFSRIGIDGKQYEEYFITDYDSDRGMLVFFCHDTNNLLDKNLGHAARLAHIGTQRKRCLHTKTPPMSC